MKKKKKKIAKQNKILQVNECVIDFSEAKLSASGLLIRIVLGMCMCFSFI